MPGLVLDVRSTVLPKAADRPLRACLYASQQGGEQERDSHEEIQQRVDGEFQVWGRAGDPLHNRTLVRTKDDDPLLSLELLDHCRGTAVSQVQRRDGASRKREVSEWECSRRGEGSRRVSLEGRGQVDVRGNRSLTSSTPSEGNIVCRRSPMSAR